MLTEYIDSVERAAKIIRDGGLVAFPTETVFGLGVDATNSDAVAKLFEAKGRPSNNPLIVHLDDGGHWSRAAAELPLVANALLDAFCPGPLTVVLPKLSDISDLVTAGLGTVGVRVPDHPIAREILRIAGVPVAAPSANRSGRPSGTTWQSVAEDLDGRIDAIFTADSSSIGIESTVVDCSGPNPVVLRPGAITLEQLQQIAPKTEDFGTGERHRVALSGKQLNSPGILHPHYQPSAEVIIVEVLPTELSIDISTASAFCGIECGAAVDAFAMIKVFASLEDYAAGFYEFLREVDRRSFTKVFVQAAPNEGIGRALRDRQRRAAGG
ncbi:L-threonylcarbamoyladenylate synthase [Rhodopirellula sp.]|nr:L-threonylcarbamoyladenylate synthase [Rhodopirellula sp.]